MGFRQAGLKKRGTSAGKLLSNQLLLSKHHHTDDCETRVSHHTSPIVTIRLEGQSMVLHLQKTYSKNCPIARRAKRAV